MGRYLQEVEKALVRRLRLVVVYEDAFQNSSRFQSSCCIVLLYSPTLIPCAHLSVIVSAMVTQSLTKTLACVEYITQSDPEFSFAMLDVSQCRVTVWEPAQLC